MTLFSLLISDEFLIVHVFYFLSLVSVFNIFKKFSSGLLGEKGFSQLNYWGHVPGLPPESTPMLVESTKISDPSESINRMPSPTEPPL